MSSGYYEVYNGWKEDPEAFWAELSKDVNWFKEPETIFDADMGIYGRWFPDGTCNNCYNCVDRHVEQGRADQLAIIYDSPMTGSKQTFTYQQLKDEVSALGAVLLKRGITKGDRVIIYMPMIPQAVFAMLACARIGAIHSVVFGGFAAKELATRIDDCAPKAVLSASCGLEPGRTVEYKPLLDDAIELSSSKPDVCLIWHRPEAEASMIEGRDFSWQEEIATAKENGETSDCVELKATDPLYILYTSGTTGIPKGVVRDNGGHMVALKWTMKAIYNIDPGDVWWTASDVGWIVGHSYIVYGPLLHGATTIVFEGKPVGTPDAGTFWRVISDYKVKTLFTAPTAFRAIKKEDPEGKFMDQYDLSSYESLFLAGERADPDTIHWAEEKLKVPVIDHWWQTETGWSIAANPLGLGMLKVKYGSPCVAMPGYQIDILDDACQPVPAGEMGAISIKLPLPPCCLPTLWQKDERFKESYLDDFPGYYQTSDAGYMDEDGYVYVMARTDDIINVAGHRLSTGGMEEVLASHPDVAECAVVGAKDALKGQTPLGFLVLKSGITKPHSDIEKEVIKLVREKIGPVAAFKQALVIERLPKTRSGKILRGTMRSIVDGETYTIPATVDDPVIFDEIKSALDSKV